MFLNLLDSLECSYQGKPTPKASNAKLEGVTLYLGIYFQLRHLYPRNYNHPSDIWGLPEIQRYASTATALAGIFCVLNVPVTCSWSCGDWTRRSHEHKLTPSINFPQHFDFPSSHMPELQNSF